MSALYTEIQIPLRDVRICCGFGAPEIVVKADFNRWADYGTNPPQNGTLLFNLT
jgi:hypothetical protein